MCRQTNALFHSITSRLAAPENERNPMTTTTTTTKEKTALAGSSSPESVLPRNNDGSGAKERVTRPTKPDRSAFDAKIATLTAVTEEKQARITEIKAIVNAKHDKKKDSSKANAPLREKFKALTAIANEKIAQRDAIREELNASEAKRNRVREEANAMRTTNKFLTNEAIDAEIARVEHKLSHENMPLSEEKKLVEKIKSLNKSRDVVQVYAEKQAVITAHDATRKQFMERIRAKDAEINGIKAEQAKLRSKLNEVKSKEDATIADVPTLHEEKTAAYEVIKATREEINKLRAEQKKIDDAYWAKEKVFRAQQKEIKQKQWEAAQEERKAREEARKQWEKENAPEPYEDEISGCDMLITYLSKWDTKKEEEVTATTTEEEVTKAVEGMVLLNRNVDDDDMFAVSGAGKKKKKGGKKQSSSINGNERIQISLDILAVFSKIKVATVSKAADVPSAIEAINARKAEFLEKRRVKKEKIAAGEEDSADDGAEAEEEEKASAKENGKSKQHDGNKKKGKKSSPVSVSIDVKEDDVIAVTVTVNDAKK